MPEYEFKLVNRDKSTEEKTIMAAVENLTTTTYKVYALASDGEKKAIVSSQEEAENIINSVKSDLKEGVELNLGIVEEFTTELACNSSEEATNALTEIKVAKTTEYEKKVEAEKAEKARLAAARRVSYVSTANLTSSGSINGLALSIPVNGMISSRYGVRSGSRSSVHTGLDIASHAGTPISPISTGTVTYASFKGSYGNLIIVSHGNGVESWYAHCNSINVSVGQSVAPGTVIGTVGSTGNSTGPHLHLEIRCGGAPVNPQDYLY